VIGNAFVPGRGFKGLALYLEHGHPGAEVRPDRVAWIETRNLPTNNLHAAARIMAATARDSDSVQPPLYHFTISFDPHDPVDEAIMRQVAHRTLREVGLEEHQAVIVAHRDRAHWHLHIMVNRVHPETLKVWNNGSITGGSSAACASRKRSLGCGWCPASTHAFPSTHPSAHPRRAAFAATPSSWPASRRRHGPICSAPTRGPRSSVGWASTGCQCSSSTAGWW
jgi:hypothetical protein